MIRGIHHTGLTVGNLEKSIEFYRDVLGLKLVFTHEASGEGLSKRIGIENASIKVAMFEVGDDLIELVEYVSPKCEPEDIRGYNVGSGHPCFLVEDIEATYEELRNKGVDFNAPPHTIQYGKMKGWKYSYAKDPDSIPFEIMEPKG